MRAKMTEKHKLMAYVLHREFEYVMTNIGTLMGVSQSTISSAIKEVEYWNTIRDLSQKLEEARSLIKLQGIPSPRDPILFLE